MSRWGNDGDKPGRINWQSIVCLAFVVAFWWLFAVQITGGF